MTDSRTLSQVLEREGPPLTIGGNRPFLLSEADSAWFVKSGSVDVFSVDVEDGRAAGARSHLFRLGAGEILWGMSQTGTAGLLAVAGMGTSLVRIPQRRLKDLAKDPFYRDAVAARIEGWVASMQSGLSRPTLSPKAAQQITCGRNQELGEGESGSVREGVVWVICSEGTVRFLGREDLPAIPANRFFPLSAGTWVAAGSKVFLRTADTTTVLRDDPDWTGVDAFHRQALEWIRLDRELVKRRGRERMDATAEVDRLALEHAYARLTSVLVPDAERFAEVSKDALLEACRRVGKAMGIEIRSYPDSRRRAKPTDPLGNIAKASRMRTRRVLLEDGWWRADAGPMLGYLEDGNKPVALLPTRPGRYMLWDPAENRRLRVNAAVAAQLSPFAYVFYPTFPDRALTGRDLLRFGMVGCKGDILRVLFMGIAVGLLGLATPIVTNQLFNSVIPSAKLDQLLTVVIALGMSALAVCLFQIVRAFAILRLEGKMDSRIEAAVWDRLLNLPLPFFRQSTAGDLALRAMGVGIIRQVLAGAVVGVFLDSIFSVFSVALLFYYSWVLALVAMAILVVAVLLSLLSTYVQYRYQRPLFNIQGRIQGMLLQFISGIAKLRVTGAEKRALSSWADAFAEQKEFSYKARIVGTAFSVFTAVLPLLSSMLIFGWFTFSHSPSLKRVTVGDFLAFTTALTNVLAGGITMIGALTPALMVGPLAERIMPIVRALPEVDAYKAQPTELSGRIEASHVSFRYSEDGPVVLKDVSFRVEPGEFVAVVGPSGSGKSTLFRLLLGFEFPNAGTIYYDDQDIAGIDVQTLRSQIGVVLQNSKVMPGSIYENIVGASLLTIDDAWEAARMCGLAEDIEAMPMQMHTMIAEGGQGLSGGQRQRILIARAIIHRPRILFFDEATSAMDNKTQAIVSRSLEGLKATRIVIAHRLSTIMNADRILVMGNGSLVQSGTYEELIHQKGAFADLAKRQIV